jgi:predicted alpha/beta-fold hydrolase
VTRQRIELLDGDFLDLDVARPDEAAEGLPWALVLHGLEGSSEAPYVRGVARALLARGVEACILNYRNCSDQENRLARSYHMGETADVRFAIDKLSESRRGRPFGLVGFSAGANLVTKLLGELGDDAPPELKAGVAVSPPYDLGRASRHLDGPGCFVYRKWLLDSLRGKALKKLARFPDAADAKAVAGARTFELYDRHFTAPVHGFRDERDYWERCSGERFLGRVKRDLLLVSALDDPFFPRGYVPLATIAANPRLRLVATDHGGHVGFVGGSVVSPTFWAEERAVEFLVPRLDPRA